jgi:hypothetical protein
MSVLARPTPSAHASVSPRSSYAPGHKIPDKDFNGLTVFALVVFALLVIIAIGTKNRGNS